METSDRPFREARVLSCTTDLFGGDRRAALEWLTTPQPALGNAVPFDLAASEAGAREVETLVARLEHGVYL